MCDTELVRSSLTKIHYSTSLFRIDAVIMLWAIPEMKIKGYLSPDKPLIEQRTQTIGEKTSHHANTDIL